MISGRGVCAGSVGPSIFSTRPDVPGRPATDQQMRMYMKLRCHHPQRVAAAKAGFSERTGRRIEGDPRLPSQKSAERPLRRKVADPLGGLWESDILPLLATRPGSVRAIGARIGRRGLFKESKSLCNGTRLKQKAARGGNRPPEYLRDLALQPADRTGLSAEGGLPAILGVRVTELGRQVLR